jgi:hypothetical protein
VTKPRAEHRVVGEARFEKLDGHSPTELGVGGDVHGGDFDLDAAARHLVRAFQDGRLGRYTLDYVPP